MKNLKSNQTAYALLRMTMGINLLGHGLVRIPKISAFSEWMVDFFKDTPLPASMVSIYSTALPFVEFGLGLLLLLGLLTYRASIIGALLMMVLIFGSCLVEQWEWVGFQMIYALFFYFLISKHQDNSWALDNKLNL